ncbi:hypothetical protein TVAG_088510 [Trichomonas vaginalis G3]|uniref:Uncharacterized protein n=1 Tax=Trichomonas vaginalis (strain ATCC PRA-98 / G3) TaxID=412133 RepID=A2EAZ6_TRIV3|nr:nuclear pore complex protein NUP155 family [Trichomonas vaginalis G3]EAY10136.1 hypothetical protein TVAG_088510 [Trichomonas vaginalis G3]KAI5534489.1 nuclear pore complex protein NUP155 family [Trichomonas vaginalis G3]|eukprot:XP_001322359.1 hypothetical protein [Trichomonas vaginalis G3]
MLRTPKAEKTDGVLPQASKRVQDIINDDEKYSDFLSQISTLADQTYYAALKRRDIATITSISPYPSEVANCGSGKLGYLSEINKYYLINSQKIYLWTPLKSDTQIVQEDGYDILAVAIMEPDYDLISDKVSNFLAISTHSYIKLYPIMDSKIITDRFYHIETNFTPFSLVGGPDNCLYAGSQLGDIHIIEIVSKQDFLSRCLGSLPKNINPFTMLDPEVVPTIKNGTASLFSEITPEFIRFRDHALIKLAYDPTTKYLAAIDEDSNIFFYKCSRRHLFHVGSHYSGDVPIVDISYVPNSDSRLIRFVGFDQQGNRLYFGFSEKLLGVSSSITLQALRKPPPEYEGKKLLSGAYSLGFCALVYNEGVFVTKSTILMRPSEEFNSFVVPCSGAHVFSLRHNLDYLSPQPVFTDAELWQHVIPAPPFLLCSLDGTAEIKPTVPFENLTRAFLESQGKLTEHLQIFLGNPPNTTGYANSLLAAQKRPEIGKSVFQIFKSIGNKPDRVSESFYKRAGRLLSPLLSLPVIESHYINVNILNLTNGYVADIKGFIPILKEYADVQADPQEKSSIAELIDYISEISEVVTFLVICSKQEPKYFTEAYGKLSVNDRYQLQQPLGQGENVLEIMKTFLRQYVLVIPTSAELDMLCAQFFSECPLIADSEEGLLEHADSLLNNASLLDDKERIPLLREAATAYMELVALFGTNLSDPIRKLTELGTPLFAIELAMAWAAKVDPSKRALEWFETGCDKNDSQGSILFSELHRIYLTTIAASITDEGLKDLKEGKHDKLYCYTIYDYLLQANLQEKLLSLKAPYLEGFVKTNARKLYWRLVVLADKKSAIEELIHLAIDGDNIELNERIDFLKEALKISKEINDKKNFSEIQKFITSAVLSTRLDKKPDRILPIKEVADISEQQLNFEVALACYNTLEDMNGIERVWKNLLQRTPELATQILIGLPKNSPAADLQMVIPLLEDTKISNKELPDDFVISTLIKSNVSLKECARIYEKLLDIALGNEKGQVMITALKLLSLHYGDVDKIKKLAREMAKDESNPYGKEIAQLLGEN